MTLYGIRNCDTVRKARKMLDTLGIIYKFVDFDETPVNETLIRQWLEYTKLETLFNTRSTTYRTLGLKMKLRNDTDKIRWMAEENRLIKRPVLDTGNMLIVGFDQALYQILPKG